jgi:flavin reductase (DIM6/NTAB) family NADH-FMN oxidoreductase RutF
MARLVIPFDQLRLRSLHVWNDGWFLLTAGDFSKRDFNTMTVSWGSLGTIWNRPFAQVVVRPTRYTHGFMERHETFTLSAFPPSYRETLRFLGTRSGRDGNKIAEARLTPMAATRVAAPCFAEADLVIECRKMYWHDIDPAHFLDPAIAEHYPARDYHRAYFGEIVTVSAGAAERP